MHVATAYYRQQLELIRAHALKRPIESMVRVDMRKNRRIHEFTQLLSVRTLRCRAGERRKSDDTNQSPPIGY